MDLAMGAFAYLVGLGMSVIGHMRHVPQWVCIQKESRQQTFYHVNKLSL